MPYLIYICALTTQIVTALTPLPNFVEELKWRGMLHDIMPGTQEHVNQKNVCGYIGFDPTAESLHIGNLTQVMTLVHFQRLGHTPLVVIGGATGSIGDPSGKSAERNSLSKSTVDQNLQAIKKQLSQFLNFEGPNAAEIINNYDWFKDIRFLDFARDVGKHITINYMTAKESIQKRLNTGLSFTEFSYQLVQGYDFYWLYKNKRCHLQMGGADQWGNMTTGTELIRRKENGKAFALTTPLLKKSDGTKFGKTEAGNIWLDPDKTSPYEFYQHWLNTSDEDAEHFIKIFTEQSQDDIQNVIASHQSHKHKRELQKTLARHITCRVHSQKGYDMAVKASNILFGNSVTADLANLDEITLLSLFEGVPHIELSRGIWENCSSTTQLLSESTQGIIFSSKGEARRLIKRGGISINKEKVNNSDQKPAFDLLQDKYLLVQRGKKTYYLIKVV